jgi:hypothetical protein
MTEQPPDSGTESPEPRAEALSPAQHRKSGATDSPNRKAAGVRPERRTDGGHGKGVGGRIEQVTEVVVWPESLIIGISTWLVGLFLTAIPLWWFGFSDEVDGGTLDLAIWVYVEGVGGTVGDEVLSVTGGATYGTFESNAFGVGPAVHALVPVVVLCLGGYLLAGRHLKAGRARRPLETVLAGGSLAIWFTLTMVLAAVLTSDGFSVNLGETLVTTLLYTGVFASVGAAVRSRARLTSAWALLAGIGAFLVGLLAWILVESPFDDIPGVGGFSDLEGTLGYTRFLRRFVAEHGTEANEILPTWFVVVVPLLFGAALAYAYDRRDPVLGFGEGARLAVTYAVLVSFVVVGHIAAQAREFEQTEDAWPETAVDTVNLLIAFAPRSILLGGVVYPVVFTALGGAVGAAVSGAVEGRAERDQQQTRRQEPRVSESRAGQHQQGHETQSDRRPASQSERRPSSQPMREPPHQPEEPTGATDQQPVGATGQEPADESTSGEQHSGWFDEQPADEDGQEYIEPDTETDEPEQPTEPGQPADESEQPAESDQQADELGEEADGEEPGPSGDTLSPGEIIGDELDEDDTGDS